MVKKAVLSLALLTVLGAAVFADYYNGHEYKCVYVASNVTSAFLSEAAEVYARQNPKVFRIPKLSNSVSQVISHALEDYTLNVGDCFAILIAERGSDYARYAAYIRITNKNGAYEYYAFDTMY